MQTDQPNKQKLRSAIAGERAVALDAERRALIQMCEIETARLRDAIATAVSNRDREVAAREAEAESTRRACAAAILKKVFAPDGLPRLISEWRREPGRVATGAIQKMWTEFNAIAQAEIGDEIGFHLLTAIFIDELASETPPNALVRLAPCDEGKEVSHRVISALGSWTRALDPADPSGGSTALENLESALLTVARWASSEALGPQHAERASLRKQHVTQRDYHAAIAAHDEVQRKACAERAAANYVAPPPPRLHRGAINDGFVSALDPDTMRGLPHAAADGGGLLNRARGWISG